MAGITQEELKRVLRYDADTGHFVRVVATSKRVKVGDIAGCVDSKGYVAIRVYTKRHRAHRLAWLYMTGSFPAAEIDHRNGVRNDNRWSNLREATTAQNRQNMAAHRDSRSGLLGVRKNTHGQLWAALIHADGTTRYIGSFPSAEEAAAAYRAAKAKLHTFNPEPRA